MSFVSEEKLLNYMRERQGVILTYINEADKGETLTRYCTPYVLGTTRAGNRAVRVYQETGGSVSGKTTGWKILRLDRILDIKPYGHMREHAPTDYRENGDDQLRNIKLQLPAYNPKPTEDTVTEQVTPEQKKALLKPLADWIKKLKERIKR